MSLSVSEPRTKGWERRHPTEVSSLLTRTPLPVGWEHEPRNRTAPQRPTPTLCSLGWAPLPSGRGPGPEHGGAGGLTEGAGVEGNETGFTNRPLGSHERRRANKALGERKPLNLDGLASCYFQK